MHKIRGQWNPQKRFYSLYFFKKHVKLSRFVLIILFLGPAILSIRMKRVRLHLHSKTQVLQAFYIYIKNNLTQSSGVVLKTHEIVILQKPIFWEQADPWILPWVMTTFSYIKKLFCHGVTFDSCLSCIKTVWVFIYFWFIYL